MTKIYCEAAIMIRNICMKSNFKVGRSGLQNRSVLYSRKGSVMKRFSVTLLTLVFGLYCGLANATLINVDFGPTTDGGGTFTSGQGETYMGPGAVVGSAGDKWNVTGLTSGVSLYDSANQSTGITLSTTGGLGEGTSAAGSAFSSSSYYKLAWDNVLVIASTPLTVTLSGVAAGNYDLYLYAIPPIDGEDRVGNYSANGKSVTIGPNNSASTFGAGTNYGILQNVVVGSDHLLTLSVVATGGGETDFNGFQLQSVPEPSSFVLLGVGLLGLLAYAWRKRK